MIIATHQAEQCLNELSACTSPRYHKARFDIIKRHMEAFAMQDTKVAVLQAELESEREANSVLTEAVEALQDEIDLKQACIKGMREQADKMAADMERLQRGEYICRKCGLRKDADPMPGMPEF